MATLVQAMTRRIGFLDDDSAMRRVMIRLSSDSEGVVLLSTGDTRQAFEWIRSGDIDVLVSDLNLATDSGIDVLERAFELSPQLQLVLFTTQTVRGDVIQRLGRISAKYYEKVSGLVEMLSDLFGIDIDASTVREVSSSTADIADVEFEREIAEEFAKHLSQITQQKALVFSGGESLTVEELTEHVRELTSTGKRYIKAWVRSNIGLDAIDG